MEHHRANYFSESTGAAEIDALLSASETASIVDRLLSLPVLADEVEPSVHWKRAVSQRLESRLADSMRTLLDTSEHRDAA